jgi:hypothetical protein
VEAGKMAGPRSWKKQHMNFQPQTGTRDCFPACFCNAMLYFDVPVAPPLAKRLHMFDQGTENCTIYSPEERLEHYERSIHKFIAEWNWAVRQRNAAEHVIPEPEEWAGYLLKKGIDLEARNGPVEQKERILNSLTKGKLALCETWTPSEEMPDSECRHFVLLIRTENGKLLVHDPLPAHASSQFDNGHIKYKRNECGSNFEIDCSYFFTDNIGPMKPKTNHYQTDSGYKLLLVGKS